MPFKHSITFFILSILFNQKILITSRLSNQFVERICSKGKYFPSPNSKDFSTSYNYYIDQRMKTTKMFDFMLSSLFNGTVSDNISQFISKAYPSILIFLLILIAIIMYIIILNWCCKKKILFVNKQNKDKNVKKMIFIIFIILLIIVISLCVTGIIFLNKYYSEINYSTCSLLHFTRNSIEGNYSTENVPKFAGMKNIINSIDNTINLINNLNDEEYSNLFKKFNDINNLNNKINTNFTKLDEKYSINNKQITLSSDKDNNSYMVTYFQQKFGEKADKNSILGDIYNNYSEINDFVNDLTLVKDDINYIYTNKDSFITTITNSKKIIENINEIFNIIEDNIAEHYLSYKNWISNKMIYIITISYILTLIINISLIPLSSIYSYKEKFNKNFLKSFLDFMWNFQFILSIFSLIISSFIFLLHIFGNESPKAITYMLSNTYMSDISNPKNIFKNYYTQTTFDSINTCYNSTTTNNMNDIIHLENTNFNYINNLYKNINNLLNSYYNILPNTIQNLTTKIPNYNNLLSNYVLDIKTITDYENFGKSDFNYNLNILNLYTDSSNDNSYQMQCFLGTKDVWVGNKKDCPENYIYSEKGNEIKNCLLLSEWNERNAYERYYPACMTNDLENLNDFTEPIFNRLKGIYNNVNTSISNITNNFSYILNNINNLENLINDEIENDYEFLNNFIKDYKNYNENNSIYDMFNCEILKNDLIDFYDSTFNNLNKYALIHFYCNLFIGIVIFISNIFIIKLLYEFYVEFYSEEEEKKENFSEKPLVKKNENENDNNNNKENNKVPSLKENSVKDEYTPNKDYFKDKVMNNKNDNNNNILNLNNNNITYSNSNQNKNSTFNNSDKNETEQ